MADFVAFNVESRAAWLRRKVGEGYLLVLGLMKQGSLEAVREAAKVWMPKVAPPDALPWIARDRGQETGFADETLDQLRNRLAKAFTIARGRGWQNAGIVSELRRIGYPNAHIENSIDDPTLSWWQFRIVLERPFPFDDQHLADGTWSSPGTWGDGGVWAGPMPDSHLVLLRAIARRRATHSRCAGIRLKYDASNPLDVVNLDA